MPLSTYINLIGFTAGTLLQLFWMVLILGYRRQRNLERVFFFLCLALFLFYGGSLLALNAGIYYASPPLGLEEFAAAVIATGLCFLPALLAHLHLEFAATRGLLTATRANRLALLCFYAASVYLVLRGVPAEISAQRFDFGVTEASLGSAFPWVLGASLLYSAGWELRFWRTAPDTPERNFHRLAALVIAAAFAGLLVSHQAFFGGSHREIFNAGFYLLPIVPFTALIYLVQRHNFLQVGRQKNLVYAVTATFLALLYLSLVRRVGGWLEPVLPPEASASILLFVLVIFIEPLQRVLAKRMQETAQMEVDRVQRLLVEIQREASQGDVARLAKFIELQTADRLGLRRVRLELPGSRDTSSSPAIASPPLPPRIANESDFTVWSDGNQLGTLHAQPHGAALSGETRAALEFLCEQLPASLDLCRLLGEKLRLERELAQREQLAMLGQMATSISHNLKNPLGSIKTILQVQMESPELPPSMRAETQMVLGEVARLSAKLNQLLQFSRPAFRGATVTANCDPAAIIEQVAGVFRHEAQQRGISLDVKLPDLGFRVMAAADAISDVVSNLLVNAMEATSSGGHVLVAAMVTDATCELSVEDDGAGISDAVREKILQPFFTTKTHGTGLGLAIVARRVQEFGGELHWESPVRNQRGTRFTVKLGTEPKRLPERSEAEK
jgi:signal transduction histidine kinase